MVLRRSVRLMNTQASLEAKRNTWRLGRNSKTKVNYTWAKYSFTNRLVLKFSTALGGGSKRVPPAPWLGKDMDSLIPQWIHYKWPHTHRYFFFFSQQSRYKVKHNWAIVLVMHNVYASKNRRKIEKSTLTKVSPMRLPVAPKRCWGRLRKITLRKLPDEVFMQKEWFWS